MALCRAPLASVTPPNVREPAGGGGGAGAQSAGAGCPEHGRWAAPKHPRGAKPWALVPPPPPQPVAMAPFGLPPCLYTSTAASMAALAASERSQQQRSVAYSTAESTLKQRFLAGAMVAAPAEGKKIEMYSKVRARPPPPRRA